MTLLELSLDSSRLWRRYAVYLTKEGPRRKVRVRGQIAAEGVLRSDKDTESDKMNF